MNAKLRRTVAVNTHNALAELHHLAGLLPNTITPQTPDATLRDALTTLERVTSLAGQGSLGLRILVREQTQPKGEVQPAGRARKR